MIWILCLLYLCNLSNAARILMFVPVPSYSHQIVFQSFWRALSQRGHEVVVITPNPTGDKTLVNVTEIGFPHFYKPFVGYNYLQYRKELSWLQFTQNLVWPIADVFLEDILTHEEVRKLYAPDSNVTFDLVISELMMMPGCYAFAHHFNAPLIGISSFGVFNQQFYNLGGPVLASHPSTWELEDATGIDLPFWQRLKNFVTLWKFIYDAIHVNFPRQQRVIERYLGTDIPSLRELESNMALVFCNQRETISFSRPKLPNVITFGGSHIEKEIKPLPKELQDFIDEPSEGFIYMSLGSNVRSEYLPHELIQTFLEIFATLPYQVIWKYGSQLAWAPTNVYVTKWLPQQQLLAHPKIKLFIYQGGLQSSEEAIHFRVPLVVIPLFSDQEYQARKMANLGVARLLKYDGITGEELKDAITDVLSNPKYKESITQLDQLNKDTPYDLTENVMWWTEYVIRNKGAPHLQCSIRNEPWYQRYDLDCVAFICFLLFTIVLSMLFLIYKLLISTLNNDEKKEKRKVKTK